MSGPAAPGPPSHSRRQSRGLGSQPPRVPSVRACGRDTRRESHAQTRCTPGRSAAGRARGGGGVESRLHGAARGSAARRPSPAPAAPLRSLLLEERQQRHRSGIMRHLSFWGAVLRVRLYRHKWQGPFFFFLRLNTTQLYVSKPVPLSIVCGWTVGVASASWPR